MWGIFPDVTLEKNHATTLLVTGLVWQYDERGEKGKDKSWVEFLAGARLNQNGYMDPILNLRFMDKRIPKFAISGEIQQSFRKDRRRILL